jgi:hypothetical protein
VGWKRVSTGCTQTITAALAEPEIPWRVSHQSIIQGTMFFRYLWMHQFPFEHWSLWVSNMVTPLALFNTFIETCCSSLSLWFLFYCFVKFLSLFNLKIMLLGSHLAPSSHCSILIENPLTSKANQENNLSRAPKAARD